MSRADEIGKLQVYGGDMYQGMTIRQAYKIAAMQGSLAGGGERGWTIAELGPWCAAVADAMLAEDSAHEAAMSGKGD